MTAQQNRTLYRRWLFEVWGAGDYDAATELVAEDLDDHNRVPNQPLGRAGDVWAAQQVRTAFPDLRFELDVLVSDDLHVTGRWTMTGTNTGPLEMLGIPPTGRPVTMTGQEIFRVQNGRFVEVWHCEDISTMLTQLKLGPPPSFVLKATARRSARQYRRQQRRSA